MMIFDDPLITSLTEQAKQNPRLRQHLNLHKSYDEASQRLLIAMEPGTYLRPHRHLVDAKPESFVGLRGRVALLVFDSTGGIEKIIPFGPGEGAAGVDLPPGIWHTIVCLEEGSVIYETKQGPYTPISEEDMAPWAPSEGDAESAAYQQSLADAARATSSGSPGRSRLVPSE